MVRRREEALAMAGEAVQIYRQLAQQRPDAFLPDLAKSLAVRGNIIAEDRPGEAMELFAEAIRLLTPLFSRYPQAHAPLMHAILGLYVKAAQSGHADPHFTLLAPAIAVFECLKPPEAYQALNPLVSTPEGEVARTRESADLARKPHVTRKPPAVRERKSTSKRLISCH